MTPSASSATSDEDKDVDKIVGYVRHVVNVQRDMGQTISLNQLDRIYERCRSSVISECRRSPTGPPNKSRGGSAARAPPASTASPAPSMTSPGEVEDVRTFDN